MTARRCWSCLRPAAHRLCEVCFRERYVESDGELRTRTHDEALARRWELLLYGTSPPLPPEGPSWSRLRRWLGEVV